MKRKLLFGGGIVTIILSVLLIIVGYYNANNIKVNASLKDNIYIMSTGKDDKTTYSVYDTYNKRIKNIFSRKNNSYSDFSVNEIDNTIYYSELDDKKYIIYKVDLSAQDKEATRMLEDDYSGDIFDINNDKIIFRTPTKNRKSETLGVYSLKDKTTQIWNNEDNDVLIFNFYWDKYNHKIYTIERSLKEMETSLTQPPTHKIFRYDENGENKQLLYSMNKDINDISVNKEGNKIIFDGITLENDTPVNRIYLLNLNDNTEQILVEPSSKFDDINITAAKIPKFSLNRNGFYFLATTPESEVIEELEGSTPIMSKAMCYYDFDSKKVNIIFEDRNVVINSFKLD